MHLSICLSLSLSVVRGAVVMSSFSVFSRHTKANKPKTGSRVGGSYEASRSQRL